MAKIFVAVASDTPNDRMILRMSQKPMVRETVILPGKTIGVEGWNFYCLDYGESMKLNMIKKIGQSLQIHKKLFNDKGTIHQIMLAGNNVTMDRFLEEAIEEIDDDEEVEENGEESEESEEGCDSVAVSDTDSEELVGVSPGVS